METLKQGNALPIAIRDRDVTKCRSLIDAGADVNSVDGTGVSPLIVACEVGKLEIVKCLIEKGAEVNFRKSNGTTPLHIAAASGRLPVLELLIQHGAALDAVTSGSTTSLFVAAAGGHATLVTKLCQAGASVDHQNHRGWTPLHAACQAGNPEAIEMLLLYGSDVEGVTSGTCSTPLHIAAMNGNLEAVEKLIDVGKACVEARQADNFTPLMLACNGGILPLVQLLLRKGAEPDAIGANLRTSTHVAALGGHASVLELLLSHGADMNAKSDSGSTPLLLATNGGHVEAVELLVHHNVIVYELNSSKPSPVLVATQRGYTQIVEIFLRQLGLDVVMMKEPKPLLNVAAIFGHLSLVKLLIQYGADPLLNENEKSLNALHEAALKGKIDVLRYLLSVGMEVDTKTGAGETALLLAAKSGHADIAEYLLTQGADVRQRRASGHTALHFAAARGDIPLARLLLEAGAEIEACQLDVGTPLYISAERGQVYMIRFLLKKGAIVDHPCTEQRRTPLHIASAWGHLAVIEALLTAGANVHAKNSFLQRPEEIIGSRKSLTVVERGLIESTFSRYKKKKVLEAKSGKSALTRDVSQRSVRATTPRAKEIKLEPAKTTIPIKLHCIEMAEPLSGVDPSNEEEGSVTQEPSSPSTASKKSISSPDSSPSPIPPPSDRAQTSIIDQITARRDAEGFRLFDIKEFMSHPSQDAAGVVSAEEAQQKPQTARTPRRPSFSWNRLHRQPGSARSDYRHSVTESPKRAPEVGSDRKKMSRSGSLSVPSLSPGAKKAANVTKSGSSPSVLPSKNLQGPLSARDSVGDGSTPTDIKSYNVFKRFPKGKRSVSHDSGTQTEETSIPARKLSPAVEVDAKGRPALFVAARDGNMGRVVRLLESGMDPNARIEEHGWTPLYAASRNGHVEVARKLLEHGARVNDTINSGASALHGACAFGQEQAARVLIDYGAKMDTTTKHGELPLHTAARNGYMHVLSLLLSADKSIIDQKRFSDGSTALHLAVEKQWAGAVKELIDWGANPGIPKEDGITPLYMTSIPGNKSIAQMILNSPIPFDVNIQTDENWTALHVACARGDLELVRLLLRAGANPNLKTNMDMTPSDVICEWVTADGGRTQRIREIIERPPTETSYMLVEAAARGDIKMVKSLLDDGADMNVFGDEGLTPLLYAVRNGHISTVHFLILREARINLSSCPGSISALHYATLGSSHQLVEFLLSNGADVRSQDEAGQTPLHYACHNGFSMAVSILLAYRADVHANDKHGKTPLYMAAASNSYESASLLLRSQAYPSCAAADGNTPLHAAAEVGGDETVQLLLGSKCDPNARNTRKETPLYLAAKHGYSTAVQRLIAHGVDLDAQDSEGNTALHAASMRGHVDVIETLISSREVSLRIKNKKGLQCNEVIGMMVGDRLDKRDREHIVILFLNRLREQQSEDVTSSPSSKVDSEVVCNIESFKCPITKEIMQTPVVASDGHTYELAAISEWISLHGTSPVTHLKLSNSTLQHNHKLRAKIEAWRSSNKRFQE